MPWYTARHTSQFATTHSQSQVGVCQIVHCRLTTNSAQEDLVPAWRLGLSDGVRTAMFLCRLCHEHSAVDADDIHEEKDAAQVGEKSEDPCLEDV